MHHLGLAHSPVLHRQMSSPTSKSFADPLPSNQDLTQDNKDVLVERLNDLISRLSMNDSLDDSAVSAIHSQVDSIESLIRGSNPSSKSPEVVSGGLGPRSPRLNENALWRPPLTPTRNVRVRFPRSPDSIPSPFTFDSIPSPFPSPIYPSQPQLQMTSSRVAEISKAAEDLAIKLEVTVLELRLRRRESDHIHDLLITRAERAADRIIELESRLSKMEDEFEFNQSELKYLRIQLHAIEAQCSHLPKNEDDELTQSIVKWKMDWEVIDRRTKARKKLHSSVAPQDNSPPTQSSLTLVDSSKL